MSASPSPLRALPTRPSASSAHAISGVVFDIQRASLHDGPGLRTTVFLKGCPLRCAWCHNPESQHFSPERGMSGKIYGRQMTVAAVMTIVRADRSYYEASGGGLTISGGEPTAQFGFCRALLAAARESGISTCLDTCGAVAPENLLALIPLVDIFHYDIKLGDPANHRHWTGRSNRLILSNLRLLQEHGCRIRLRCPIIPGVNDTADHEAWLRELEQCPGIESVERLPYHHIGDAKYLDLRRQPPRFPISPDSTPGSPAH